ncbi:MAG: endolytic transglycosylase MltG [Chlorobi bacterium]|nr:endolytic transglycosylase MltG [Chlorobiota bacterium]
MKTAGKILGLLLLAALVGGGVMYVLFFAPNVKTESALITVPPGTSAEETVSLLSPHLVRPATYARAVRIKKFSPEPGKYRIRRGMSNNQIINMLRAGWQTEITLTFNNISSLEELAGKVASRIIADSTELIRAFRDPAFLDSTGFTRENALLMYLPNTYRLYYTTTADEFRQRMWKEYNRYWNKERREAARRLGLTPVEAGILASIVKKETLRPEEKPVIAGVYLNRLKRGMKLEADPTAVYAYKRATGDTSVIRRVLHKHIEIDDPYNTYRYYGLPPGPVSMPDLSDIEAVLHPARHDYLYFVADPARPGYHLFASTYAQHLRNARRYRRYLDTRGIKR